MKKTLALLLLLALLLCAVACAKQPEPEQGGGDPPPAAPIDDGLTYDGIIRAYTKLLTAKANNEALVAPTDLTEEIGNALYEIVRDCTDVAAMGYATKDLGKDGVEELVLLDKSNKLYALFTLKDRVPVLLLKTDAMRAYVSSDGTLYARRFIEETMTSYTYIKNIVNGTLKGLEFGSVMGGDPGSYYMTYYKIENGTRSEITGEEYLALDRSVMSNKSRAPYYNKTTGFRFVPAITGASTPSTAPVPDFSDYDGILAAYRTIVESFSEYSESDWVNGKFDALFQISDNEAYEIFHQIFYGGICAIPRETRFGQDFAKDFERTFGYAKKDLNGDGIEELILLNDRYHIFAMFTQKDGKAVLLDGAAGTWIDADGYLRGSRAVGGVVDRDGEFFVYKIDGAALSTVVGVGYQVNVYLEKHGWYQIDGNTRTEISKEEGEAMLARYDIRPEVCSASEYTKSFSGIVFTPLTEAATASQRHLGTFGSEEYIGGNTLTVSAVSEHSVTFHMDFVHIVGEFDPETLREPEVYRTPVTGEAVRNGNLYAFDIDGIQGYLEFTVTGVWMVVTESQNEHVACRAYLFNYPEE